MGYNHSWSQPQQSFGQTSQMPQDFNFPVPPGRSNDRRQRLPEHQDSFTFQAQPQLPPGGTSAAAMHPGFPSNQPQNQRPAMHFNPAAQQTANVFDNAAVYGSANTTFNTVYSSPPAEWTVPASVSGLHNSMSNNAAFNGIADPTYMPQHNTSSPAVSSQHLQPNMLGHSYTRSLDHKPKRSRHEDNVLDVGEDEQDQEVTTDTKDGGKPKSGACARCKSLKVKCEFKTDTDPCKRCMSGGHACYIPGRKKRRTPPKREDLLNQIKDQARQIKDLMAQLETSDSNGLRRRRSSGASSDHWASSSGLQSPIFPPSSPSDAYSATESEINGNKAIEDWLSKAKQSFQEFDVFIGSSMPTNYIVDESLFDDDSDEEYEDAPDGPADWEIAVQGPDGVEIPSNVGSLKHKSSASSVGTDGTGVTKSRKSGFGSAKPANVPNVEVPFGLMAQLSLGSGDSTENGTERSTGIADKDFFRAKQGQTPWHWPQILTRKIITPQEAEKLFQIYYDHMNISLSLLDPVLYTPQKTCYRSPFLFTVICAIASRYYSERPDLYPQLIHHAQQAAGVTLISGTKNVEMCSAFILLALYPVPAKKWEDQRGWLYLGLAIRTATDINLNLPNTAKPLNENHAREMLNRTRVWLSCFNLDRSTGSQYGKPPIITPTDYMANNSENWWRSSPYNMKNFDIHICAYNAELRVMGRFVSRIYGNPGHPLGLNTDADFELIATETDEELKQLQSHWIAILEEHADLKDPMCAFRTGLLKLAYPYTRLVALSYGFQHAFGKKDTDENPFLMRCLSAAEDVLVPAVNDLFQPSQRGFLRHGPEAQSVFISFAAAFLVKLLQPRFTSYLSLEKRREIRSLVQTVVDLLGSSDISVDERHGPKLYSKFLKNLLAQPMAKVDANTSAAPVRKPKRNVTSPGKVASERALSEVGTDVVVPSPGHTGSSLSPPPRRDALSFESFVPSGGFDPYGPDLGPSNSLSLYLGGNMEDGMNVVTDFFNPPLPHDDDLMRNINMLSDPSGWQNTTGQFQGNISWDMLQQNLGMEFNHQDPMMYNNDFMTGP